MVILKELIREVIYICISSFKLHSLQTVWYREHFPEEKQESHKLVEVLASRSPIHLLDGIASEVATLYQLGRSYCKHYNVIAVVISIGDI